MIPTMSDQLDNELRHRQKKGSFGDDDRLYPITSVNAMNGSLFSEQLFHGVDPSLLQGTNPQSHEILMEQVREAAEQAKGTFVAHMENQLKNMKVSDNRLVRPGVEELDSNENKKSLRVSGDKFLPRQSMLTDLLQNKNIRTLNNIFVAVLFVIILNSALMHLLNFRNVGVTFELAFWTIGKVPLVLYIWCQMMLWATAAFFSTLSIWAHHPSSTVGPWKIPNVAWLVLYIAGVLAFLIYPPVFVIYHDLPVLSSFIVLMEQVRLIMKMHAFLRVVIPRALAWKHKVNDEINGIDREWEVNTPPKNMDEDAPCPDFSCYLYFLFAPTLIYQDKYPMSSRIRWNIVRQNVVQCFVTGCYVFLILEKMIMPVTVTFAEDTYTFGDFIKAVCTCMIPACACLFLSFYTVLHCWLNAAGEMVRFADRQFYKDWWNATSFAGFYRDWNLVVHTWLYTYIYKDLRAIGLGPKKAMLCVFLLSAVFHEYIISCSLRFCFPVLFIIFGCFGVVLLLIPDLGSNSFRGTMLWLSLFIGCGILASLYNCEWSSRKNCPSDMEWYVDIFIPRLFFCSKFQFY